VQLIKYFH